MSEANLTEPWLRGTLSEVPAVARGVLHALELAREDLERWCGHLSDEELNLRPSGIAPAAFHLRHIARSIDRLLTYAEGSALNSEQLAALKGELEPGAKDTEIFAELAATWENAARRVRVLSAGNLEESRTVGGKQLPSTLGGLLVHVADHTQRHVGQAVTTAKIVTALRGQNK